MAEPHLASTLATGTALLAVTYLLVRTNRRRRAASSGSFGTRGPRSDGQTDDSRGTDESRPSRLARTPRAWYLGVAAAVLGVVVAGIAAVSGLAQSAGALAALGLVALVGLYLVVGTYATAKSRGRPESLAIAEGIGVLGGLALLGMIVVLVLG
ncbi:MAG TPA: hypothetical protein VKM69_03445 [Natronoarchaeum rubrum]|nr:hypothetical protein [Natronoarchaeum rubrum]